MTRGSSLHGTPVCLNAHAENHYDKAAPEEQKQKVISMLDITSLDLKYALTRFTLHPLQGFLHISTCDPQIADYLIWIITRESCKRSLFYVLQSLYAYKIYENISFTVQNLRNCCQYPTLVLSQVGTINQCVSIHFIHPLICMCIGMCLWLGCLCRSPSKFCGRQRGWPESKISSHLGITFK